MSDMREHPSSRRPDLPKLTVPPRLSNQSIPRADPLQIPIPKDFNAYLVLEPNLQPIQADTNSLESIRIFEEHKRLSQEFLKMKMEVTLLTTRKQELESSDKTISSIQEYFDLKEENNDLRRLKENMITQLDMIKKRQRQREATADGDWVLVDRTETHNNPNWSLTLVVAILVVTNFVIMFLLFTDIYICIEIILILEIKTEF